MLKKITTKLKELTRRHYLCHMLVDGCHASIYSDVHPTELLTKKFAKDRTVVIINFWRITRRQYKQIGEGRK